MENYFVANLRMLMHDVRQNRAVRFICKPFVQRWRDYREKEYVTSMDCQYLSSIYNIHEGKRCFIIGNGPSLTVDDLEKMKDEYSFGSNYIFQLFSETAWRPTYYVAGDKDFIIMNTKAIAAIDANEKFIVHSAKKYIDGIDSRIHFFFLKDSFVVNYSAKETEPIKKDISKYMKNASTVTFLSIQLAIHMGFSEIYLLGVDHQFVYMIDKTGKRRRTKMKDHVNKVKVNGRYYIDFMTSGYQRCREFADENGIKIYNATRGGKLEVFERVDFDTVMEKQGSFV